MVSEELFWTQELFLVMHLHLSLSLLEHIHWINENVTWWFDDENP